MFFSTVGSAGRTKEEKPSPAPTKEEERKEEAQGGEAFSDSAAQSVRQNAKKKTGAEMRRRKRGHSCGQTGHQIDFNSLD